MSAARFAHCWETIGDGEATRHLLSPTCDSTVVRHENTFTTWAARGQRGQQEKPVLNPGGVEVVTVEKPRCPECVELAEALEAARAEKVRRVAAARARYEARRPVRKGGYNRFSSVAPSARRHGRG